MPIFAHGEVIYKFRKDIKSELCIFPNKEGTYSKIIFPETTPWGTLYITNYRFIYLRKPSLKSSTDTTECTEILRLWSKRWIEEGKYECISLPYELMSDWADTGFFKGKKVTIILKTKDNRFEFNIRGRFSNRSIINFLTEMKDIKGNTNKE